jgi:hypothetical protein
MQGWHDELGVSNPPMTGEMLMVLYGSRLITVQVAETGILHPGWEIHSGPHTYGPDKRAHARRPG